MGLNLSTLLHGLNRFSTLLHGLNRFSTLLLGLNRGSPRYCMDSIGVLRVLAWTPSLLNAIAWTPSLLNALAWTPSPRAYWSAWNVSSSKVNSPVVAAAAPPVASAEAFGWLVALCLSSGLLPSRTWLYVGLVHALAQIGWTWHTGGAGCCTGGRMLCARDRERLSAATMATMSAESTAHMLWYQLRIDMRSLLA